jgi:hypothetical protein
MALRAGRKDPVLQAVAEQELPDASGEWRNLARRQWMGRSGTLVPSLVRSTANSELERTRGIRLFN